MNMKDNELNATKLNTVKVPQPPETPSAAKSSQFSRRPSMKLVVKRVATTQKSIETVSTQQKENEETRKSVISDPSQYASTPKPGNRTAKDDELKNRHIFELNVTNLLRMYKEPELRTHRDIVKMIDIVCQIYGVLKGVSIQDQYQVCQVLTVETLGRQAVLFDKGDPADKFYMILSGKVDLFHLTKDELFKEDTTALPPPVASVSPGMTFGEIGMIQNSGRTATAVTRSKTTCLTFNKENFDKVVAPVFMKHLQQKADYLQKLPGIFSRVPYTLLMRLSHHISNRHLYTGEKIQLPNVTKLWFIIDGECHLTYEPRIKKGPERLNFFETETERQEPPKTIARMSGGMWFGENSIFPELRRDFTVVCVKNAALYGICAHDMKAVFDPEVLEELREAAVFMTECYDEVLARKLHRERVRIAEEKKDPKRLERYEFVDDDYPMASIIEKFKSDMGPECSLLSSEHQPQQPHNKEDLHYSVISEPRYLLELKMASMAQLKTLDAPRRTPRPFSTYYSIPKNNSALSFQDSLHPGPVDTSVQPSNSTKNISYDASFDFSPEECPAIRRAKNFFLTGLDVALENDLSKMAQVLGENIADAKCSLMEMHRTKHPPNSQFASPTRLSNSRVGASSPRVNPWMVPSELEHSTMPQRPNLAVPFHFTNASSHNPHPSTSTSFHNPRSSTSPTYVPNPSENSPVLAPNITPYPSSTSSGIPDPCTTANSQIRYPSTSKSSNNPCLSTSPKYIPEPSENSPVPAPNITPHPPRGLPQNAIRRLPLHLIDSDPKSENQNSWRSSKGQRYSSGSQSARGGRAKPFMRVDGMSEGAQMNQDQRTRRCGVLIPEPQQAPKYCVTIPSQRHHPLRVQNPPLSLGLKGQTFHREFVPKKKACAKSSPSTSAPSSRAVSRSHMQSPSEPTDVKSDGSVVAQNAQQKARSDIYNHRNCQSVGSRLPVRATSFHQHQHVLRRSHQTQQEFESKGARGSGRSSGKTRPLTAHGASCRIFGTRDDGRFN